MICANCRDHHDTRQEVRNCFTAAAPNCRHELPNGQCPCTWEPNPRYQGTHSYVHRAKDIGFDVWCDICTTQIEPGDKIVKSRKTWGRWVHYKDCLEVATYVLSNPPREYQDALGNKPWDPTLGTPRQMVECEDSFFIDPRDEIEDTDDALHALLVSEGISDMLITEWREMLPDVVERTILGAIADGLVEDECLEEWEVEVEMMHMADAGTSWS